MDGVAGPSRRSYGVAAPRADVLALASVVAERTGGEGVYSAHGRHIEFGRAGAFRETVEIGERAGLRAHIAHERVDEAVGALLAGRIDGVSGKTVAVVVSGGNVSAQTASDILKGNRPTDDSP